MNAAKPAPAAAAPGVSPAAQVTASEVRVIRDLHSGLDIRLTETAGRAGVAVCGEIDLGCAHLLEQVLTETLRTAPGGLHLDLSGVAFFDCSGVNVLLRLRLLAEEIGARLVVTRMSPPVARVLDIVGCRALLA